MTLIVKGKLPNVVRNNKRLLRILPQKIAVLSNEHYVRGFDRGGKQTDDSLDGWKERKNQSQRNRGRAILVSSGDYRRSAAILSVNSMMIKLGTIGIPYASFHNEGTDKLPKREVYGPSKKLDLKIRKLIILEAKKQNR